MEDTEDVISELSKVQEDISKLTTKNTTFITIKRGSKVKNVVRFASKTIQEATVDKIVLTGEGKAITKVISCAEILKREITNLHQVTNIFSKKTENETSPDATVQKNFLMPAISILLSESAIEENGAEEANDSELQGDSKQFSKHNKKRKATKQPIMSAQKRKRTDFTLKEKKDIIDAAKKEPNQSKLAREISKKWGVEVKRTTVKSILSKRDAIEDAIKAGVPSKRMKLTQAHDPKLDEGVLMWLKQARGQNLPVSGDLIKKKAMKLAELMHIPDFMASDGWLDKFKKRHGITFKTVQGEAAAVDSQFLLEWQQQVIRPLLKQFSADEVCSEEPVESEYDDITVEEEVVPFQEAQRAWSTVRKFMQQRSWKSGVMQACDRLDNEMHVIRQKKMRQPTILESFGLISNLRK